MPAHTVAIRKVTISLPVDLLEFADQQAIQRGLSRSRLIAEALAELKAREEAQLAAEGYRFYAEEASDFAASSQGAVAEAWGHDS